MIAQTSFQQHVTAKLEFYLLCITLFVLPTMESPKTITLVLYLIVSTANRHLTRDLAIVAGSAGLTGLGTRVSIPPGPEPCTHPTESMLPGRAKKLHRSINNFEERTSRRRSGDIPAILQKLFAGLLGGWIWTGLLNQDQASGFLGALLVAVLGSAIVLLILRQVRGPK